MVTGNQGRGDSLTLIQINNNRSAASMDLTLALAQERGAHIILSSEPNKKKLKSPKWLKDEMLDAAILKMDPKPVIMGTGGGPGFVWIAIINTYVYSCYVSPNISIEDYEKFVRELSEDVRAKLPADVIVTGDFNAKSPNWGGSTEDRRGVVIGEMMASLGLVAANEGGDPTFVRGSSRSIIDITMVTEGLLEKVENWKVTDDESLSPHRFIIFKINKHVARQEEVWRRGPISRAHLGEALRRRTTGDMNGTPEELSNILKAAYIETTPKVRTTKGKIPYWWTEDIAELRASANKLRRQKTRLTTGREEEARTRMEVQYKQAKKNLCREIRRSKRNCWRKTLEDLDNDVYGQGYKIVTNSLNLRSPSAPLTKKEERHQIMKLFPEAPEVIWNREEVEEMPALEINEIREAARGLKNGKAPGPDGVPSEVVKVAADEIPEYLETVLNNLLRQGRFPKAWKAAKVVLLEKPTKGAETAKAYRPVCLINSVAKLYESLINRRIAEHLEREGELSRNQHGFRKGHSTMNAIQTVINAAREIHVRTGNWCLLALVDVRNAFNSAGWREIEQAIGRKGDPPYLRNVIREYLSERNIMTKTGIRRQCNVGVPQGSVLGPTLWNVMYDGVFTAVTQEDAHVVGYADDIAVIVQHKDWEGAKGRMEEALEEIGVWLEENGLEMAPEKTEIVALKYGRRRREGVVRAMGTEVEVGQGAKYLGVWIDTAVTFGPHIKAAAVKAEVTAKKLVRLMPNIGGPGEVKRRMLGAAAEAIMLYGAPIWAGAMNVAAYRRALQGVQRRLALRVCRAYRTASYEAVTVIASTIPIHLLAAERRRIWERGPATKENKRREREETLVRWQKEWDEAEKGRWTRRLIQDVKTWVGRGHGQVDYWLTQWLTGHGSFASYTRRIGKTELGGCGDCGGEEDTAEHAIFHCSRWDMERMDLVAFAGENMTVGNVIPWMLRSRENWARVHRFVGEIMKTKEEEGRREEGKE